MNIKVWCKSFLSIYHIIPNIVNSIDRLVLLKGINSAYYSHGQNNSTIKQIDSVINLSQKKVSLINLKVLTDEVLLEMNEKNSKLLIIRFINNINCKKAIELSGMTRRTYFRALNRALNEFEGLFYRKILKNKSLYQTFLKEDELEDIFEKINLFGKESRCEDYFVDYSDSLCSFIVNKFKKLV